MSTLTTGLISYWDLNNDLDDKHGTNDFTASGGASGSATGGPGGDGYYQTTAVSHLIETPFTEDFSGGEYSTAMWIYSAGDGSGPYPMCAYSNTGGTSFQVIGGASFKDEQSVCRVALHNSAGSFFAGTGVAFTEGSWQFVVVRVNEATGEASVSVNDGATIDTIAWTGSIKDNELYFGTAAATNRWFNGRFAKVGVWNKILSSAEETELYNLGNGLLYSEIGAGGASNNKVLTHGGNL